MVEFYHKQYIREDWVDNDIGVFELESLGIFNPNKYNES